MRNTDPRLFLSYRRADSAAIVGHLYERLAAHFGRGCVFRDIDDIPLGMDYRDRVTGELAGCDVVLAVIGPDWTGGSGDDARILQPGDPIRIEIEAALAAGALLVPVLVGEAIMPKAAVLPGSLERLPALNAARLTTGHDFEHHLVTLVASLDAALAQRGKFVTTMPQWTRGAAFGFLAAAVSPILVLAASAWFGVPLQLWLVQASAIAIAVLAALGIALLVAELCASRRIGVPALARRPHMAGVAAYMLAMPLFYLAGSGLAAIMPLHDANHLSKALLAQFAAERSKLGTGGKPDFAAATALVDAIRDIDPENGTAWYFAGEIERIGTPALFDAKGCFKGGLPGQKTSLDAYQQDFYRYIEIDRKAGGGSRETDWGTNACYESPWGLCAQRTAWIYQLLANDGYHKALMSAGEERMANLREARDYVRQALRYVRPEGGNGFTQCMDSAALLATIESGLGE